MGRQSLTVLIIMLTVLAGCAGGGVTSISNLLNDPDSYMGQEISIEGLTGTYDSCVYEGGATILTVEDEQGNYVYARPSRTQINQHGQDTFDGVFVEGMTEGAMKYGLPAPGEKCYAVVEEFDDS